MKSKSDIIKELKYISERMISCGTAMDYYGGFGWIAEHGRQMVGAGLIAKQWATEWEKESASCCSDFGVIASHSQITGNAKMSKEWESNEKQVKQAHKNPNQ